jgi:hypothetical protein
MSKEILEIVKGTIWTPRQPNQPRSLVLNSSDLVKTIDPPEGKFIKDKMQG